MLDRSRSVCQIELNTTTRDPIPFPSIDGSSIDKLSGLTERVHGDGRRSASERVWAFGEASSLRAA